MSKNKRLPLLTKLEISLHTNAMSWPQMELVPGLIHSEQKSGFFIQEQMIA